MWERQARFCPLCAGALTRKAKIHRERLVCSQCEFVLYENPAAAAAAIVLRGDEVLLIRRGIEPFRGHWALPAGYEEVDESPAVTAVRETFEETGAVIEVRGLYDVLYTSDDPRKRAILIAFVCEQVGGTLQAGDDAQDVRYFPLDRLPPSIGFANNQRLLARLVAEWRAGAIQMVRTLELP